MDDEIQYRGEGLVEQVGNLYRRALCRRVRNDWLVSTDALPSDGDDHRLIHTMRCPQLEFLTLLIENVDATPIGRRELHRLGNNGGQHCLEVERGIDRLAHLTERFQLLDRPRQFSGTGTQLI